jgi:putative transposase
MQSVDLFTIVPTHSKSRGETTHPLLARHLRRYLLRPEKRLSLATLALRLPSVVYRVYYHSRKFRLSGAWHLIYRALCGAERKRVGKNPEASAAIIDSQSVKTTEEGAQSNGYDAHKNVKGRKRHLLVDTLGLPLSVYVMAANVQDRVGARLLLAGVNPLVPRLKKIWADGAYSGEELARWCEQRGRWKLKKVERDREAEGFEVSPKRWIVERTFSWLIRNRRLSKDYERRAQTSETLIEAAAIRHLLRRLARKA